MSVILEKPDNLFKDYLNILNYNWGYEKYFNSIFLGSTYHTYYFINMNNTLCNYVQNNYQELSISNFSDINFLNVLKNYSHKNYWKLYFNIIGQKNQSFINWFSLISNYNNYNVDVDVNEFNKKFEKWNQHNNIFEELKTYGKLKQIKFLKNFIISYAAQIDIPEKKEYLLKQNEWIAIYWIYQFNENKLEWVDFINWLKNVDYMNYAYMNYKNHNEMQYILWNTINYVDMNSYLFIKKWTSIINKVNDVVHLIEFIYDTNNIVKLYKWFDKSKFKNNVGYQIYLNLVPISVKHWTQEYKAHYINYVLNTKYDFDINIPMLNVGVDWIEYKKYEWQRELWTHLYGPPRPDGVFEESDGVFFDVIDEHLGKFVMTLELILAYRKLSDASIQMLYIDGVITGSEYKSVMQARALNITQNDIRQEMADLQFIWSYVKIKTKYVVALEEKVKDYEILIDLLDVLESYIIESKEFNATTDLDLDYQKYIAKKVRSVQEFKKSLADRILKDDKFLASSKYYTSQRKLYKEEMNNIRKLQNLKNTNWDDYNNKSYKDELKWRQIFKNKKDVL